MMTWQWVALVIGALVLAFVSRPALRKPRSHGFYRYFAWVAMWAVFLLNVSEWFTDPLSLHQVVSWALLALCVVPAVWGAVVFGKHGRPARERDDDPTLFAFERTTQLVTTGIYRWIRHPLYGALILLTWGIVFKQPAWPALLLGVGATGLLYATARADERECVRFFGPAYERYMSSTRLFIPFVF